MNINRQFGMFMRDLFAGNVEIRTEAENSGDGHVPVLFVADDATADEPSLRLSGDALDWAHMHPRDLYLWTKAWPAVFTAYPEDEAPPMRIMKSKKWERRRNKAYAKRLLLMDAMCERIMSVYDAEATKHA